jgi:hypothetical protein
MSGKRRRKVVLLVENFRARASTLGRCPLSFDRCSISCTPHVIDGRGTLNLVTWRDAVWTVRALGRP